MKHRCKHLFNSNNKKCKKKRSLNLLNKVTKSDTKIITASKYRIQKKPQIINSKMSKSRQTVFDFVKRPFVL